MTIVMMFRMVALSLAVILSPASTALAAAAPSASLLVLPVAFTDTSGEVADQTADHDRRVVLVARTIAETLAPTGVQVDVLDHADMERLCPRAESDCLLALAKSRGAARILLTETFKTSTLILEMNTRLIDTASNTLVLRRFISFRGDNDESWRRAARFVAGQVRDAG